MAVGPRLTSGQSPQKRRPIDWSAYGFALPAVLLLAIVHAYPIFRLITMSFQETDVLHGTATWVGTKNYASLLTDATVWKCVQNTVVYSVGVVLGLLGTALALAFAAQPLGQRAQHLLRGAFYLPGVLSVIVTALVWTRLYDPEFGLVNGALRLLGGNGPAWLGDTQWALFALVIMAILSGLGAPFVLCTTAIANIPAEYYEAASLEGAGPVAQFRAVTLPLIRSTLVYLLLMLTIGSFQVFGVIYVMTEGGPDFSTATVVFLVYEEAFRYFDFGRASALSTLLTAFLMIVAVVQFRRFGRDPED